MYMNSAVHSLLHDCAHEYPLYNTTWKIVWHIYNIKNEYF